MAVGSDQELVPPVVMARFIRDGILQRKAPGLKSATSAILEGQK